MGVGAVVSNGQDGPFPGGVPLLPALGRLGLVVLVELEGRCLGRLPSLQVGVE